MDTECGPNITTCLTNHSTIYLYVTLDPKVAARRKKYGGNKKQNFTEGWVEFKDKSIAKQVAKSLNATIIGGSKKSFYHDDMWNIKYLPKFKWDHLTERIGKIA